MMTEPVSITKISPISGRTRIWPVIRAMTASVAPSDSEPESPMKIWAGWTLNHRKPEQRADDQRAQEGEVRLGGHVEQGDEQERDEREDERPAGEAVEAVGDVDAVAGGDDRERGEEDVDRRVDRGPSPTNGTRDLVDVVGPLDVERGGEREHDLPEELLADADPLAGLGVQVVVERAEQRRRRRARRAARRCRPRAASAGAGTGRGRRR